MHKNILCRDRQLTARKEDHSPSRSLWRGGWGVRLATILLLAACQTATPAPADNLQPDVQAKVLATVFMSPTPNEAEQQATRRAIEPTLTAPPTAAPPTATVYVGVFLEPAESGDDVPILDATQALAFAPQIPTVRPSRCQIPVAAQLGETWRDDPTAGPALGCAIEPVVTFDGVVQIFENGVMYFQSNGPIWAIETTNDGFPNQHWTVTTTLPPVDEASSITAPPGLQVPQLGFGSVWFNIDRVRETLGFARTDEQRASLAFQRFDNGTLFGDINSGLVYVLLSDGTAFGPF